MVSTHSEPKNTEVKWRAGYLVLALLFLVFINLVFVSLALRTPSGYQYTGVGLEAVADKLVYFSMIEQGRAGRLWMQNVQTTEPQQGALFSPHWYLIGQTAEMFHLSTPFAYHLFRSFFTIVFLIILFFLIQKLFTDFRERILAAGTVLFGSGLGWLYFVAHPYIISHDFHWMYYFNIFPSDLYIVESVPLVNFLQSPLFILSHTLLVLIFFIMVRAATERSWINDALLFTFVLLLVLIHPYDAGIIAAVAGTWTVSEIAVSRSWRAMRRLAVMLVAIAIAAFITANAFAQEPALSGWLKQNITFSPNIGAYLWGTGVMLFLALASCVIIFRKNLSSPWWRLMAIWALIPLILMYLPVAVNRRFTNAWFIPLSFVGTYMLVYLFQKLRHYVLQAVLATLIMLFVFSSAIYHTIQSVTYQPKPSERYSYYLDPVIWDAIQFAKDNFDYPDRIIVNEDLISMLFGAYIRSSVYIGHVHQTVQYPLKKQMAAWFFGVPKTALAVERKKDFLKDAGISYVIIYKPSMAVDFDWMATAGYLKPIYENAAVLIYAVDIVSANE